MPLLAHLVEQLLELIAQRLLSLRQVAHAVLVALLALLLALLPALARLVLLTALPLLAALVLTLLEGLVAQFLLLAGQVAELVHHRLHLVVDIVLLLPLLHCAAGCRASTASG